MRHIIHAGTVNYYFRVTIQINMTYENDQSLVFYLYCRNDNYRVQTINKEGRDDGR